MKLLSEEQKICIECLKHKTVNKVCLCYTCPQGLRERGKRAKSDRGQSEKVGGTD
jgi:hypothetical protein